MGELTIERLDATLDQLRVMKHTSISGDPVTEGAAS